MKHYTFTAEAASIIERAGVEQATLAERADYDKFQLNRRLKGGRIRGSSAHRIAQAFAELSRMGKEEAFSKLFDEVIDKTQ